MLASERDVLIATAVVGLACRATDFDPLELLHDLTECVVRLVGVPVAGVTVLDSTGQVDYATAADERSRALEEEQIVLEEGPCLDSIRGRLSTDPVALDEGGARRWPRFSRFARHAGIAAVAAVPLRGPAGPLAALNLMTTAPPAPSALDMRLAQALADAAASCFIHRHELNARDTLILQVQEALDSRIVVEQAKGILSERLRLGMDDAFRWLRSRARSRQQTLSVLATQIALGTAPPDLYTTP